MTVNTDTSHLQVHVLEAAQREIVKIHEQVAGVMQMWHIYDPERAMKTALTASRGLAGLMNSGFGNDVTISRDGELSLYVSTPSFVYGLIGFPAFRADAPMSDDMRLVHAPVLGRFCMINNAYTGNGICGKPVIRGEVTCDCKTPWIAAVPIPIEWSSHS